MKTMKYENKYNNLQDIMRFNFSVYSRDEKTNKRTILKPNEINEKIKNIGVKSVKIVSGFFAEDFNFHVILQDNFEFYIMMFHPKEVVKLWKENIQ